MPRGSNPHSPEIERVWQASQRWREEADADWAVINPVVTRSIEFEWVTVPAGSFLMGDKEEQTCGGRQDQIFVPEFKIARTLVTNAQYASFIIGTGHSTPEHWIKGRIPQGRENHPVVNVSWNDAMAFCGWVNVRLPTEAEWEKAARWTDGRAFPWGNESPTAALCNFSGAYLWDTTPVGAYPKGASPYGVLDMAGNVWEWTSSLIWEYPYDASDGREGSGGWNARVLRGGAWNSGDKEVRCAARSRDYGGENRTLPSTCGFRVVSLDI